MQPEIEQVCAEFAMWAAAQTDEGIKSRCQIILSNLRKQSADPQNEALLMPLSTRRSFTRGTPRGLFGRNGLIAAHSQSVSS